MAETVPPIDIIPIYLDASIGDDNIAETNLFRYVEILDELQSLEVAIAKAIAKSKSELLEELDLVRRKMVYKTMTRVALNLRTINERGFSAVIKKKSYNVKIRGELSLSESVSFPPNTYIVGKSSDLSTINISLTDFIIKDRTAEAEAAFEKSYKGGKLEDLSRLVGDAAQKIAEAAETVAEVARELEEHKSKCHKPKLTPKAIDELSAITMINFEGEGGIKKLGVKIKIDEDPADTQVVIPTGDVEADRFLAGLDIVKMKRERAVIEDIDVEMINNVSARKGIAFAIAKMEDDDDSSSFSAISKSATGRASLNRVNMAITSAGSYIVAASRKPIAASFAAVTKRPARMISVKVRAVSNVASFSAVSSYSVVAARAPRPVAKDLTTDETEDFDLRDVITEGSNVLLLEKQVKAAMSNSLVAKRSKIQSLNSSISGLTIYPSFAQNVVLMPNHKNYVGIFKPGFVVNDATHINKVAAPIAYDMILHRAYIDTTAANGSLGQPIYVRMMRITADGQTTEPIIPSNLETVSVGSETGFVQVLVESAADRYKMLQMSANLYLGENIYVEIVANTTVRLETLTIIGEVLINP